MLSKAKHLSRVIVRSRAARPGCFALLNVTFSLVGISSATAQQPAPRVYTYVERMPQLPSGGGMAAVVAAFQKRLRVPVFSLQADYTGSARVYFEVSPLGTVQHVRLTKSTHSPQVDSAIVAAVRALPTFTPGYQAGRPVTVSLTMLIACLKLQ